MSQPSWEQFVAELRADYDTKRLDLTQSIPRFREFAKSVPDDARLPLLLATYDRYRNLGPGCRLAGSPDYFDSSAYGILISELLRLKLKPTSQEACAILSKSFHYCGHGGDVDPPVTLAEKAFEERAYTPEFLDAVRAYQGVLKGTRSTTAQ